MKYIYLLIALVVAAALTAHAGAQDITETIVWDGDHPIKDSLATKSAGEASLTRANAVYTALEKLELPYKFSEGKTTITVKKVAYDEKRAVYGVWIEATRDGKEVYTRSPIWVRNSPIVVETSRVSTSAESVTVTLKEDPLKAFERVMLDYCDRRPLGKAEGDDSMVVYCADNSEESAVSASTSSNTFSNKRGEAGSSVSGSTDTTTGSTGNLRQTSTEPNYDRFSRLITIMDTSGLPDTCTIDSATVSVHVYAEYTGLGTYYLGITGGTVENTEAIAAGDFDGFGGTRFASDIDPTTGAYNDFTLNAAGLAAISKTGYSVFFIRTAWDIDDSAPAWVGSQSGGARFSLPHRGDEYRALIDITYTPGGGSAPVAAFSATPISGIRPMKVTFTDSSTESPSSWYWMFGDGTTSTSQNPVKWYTKGGKYSVNLQATNDNGNDWENKTDYLRVIWRWQLTQSNQKPNNIILIFSKLNEENNIDIMFRNDLK